MNKLLKNKRNMHTHKNKTQHKEEKASIFWKPENIISDKLCLVFFFSLQSGFIHTKCISLVLVVMVVSDNEDIIRDVHISPYENKMGTSLTEVWQTITWIT